MRISAHLRILRTWVQIVLTVAVAALLWPSSLGGRVDYVMVSGHSMEPGLHDGDLVLVRDADHYEVGDAVAYRIADGEVGEGSIVIHRITGGNAKDGFTTQGDNRDSVDPWLPTEGEVLGERWLLVPGAGKAVAKLRSPALLGLVAGGLALVSVAAPSRKRDTVPVV